jgi:cell division protease FtsH
VQNQYLDGQMGLTCAQDTAAGIDDEVRAIIEQCHADAIHTLEENREMLDKIAAYLMDKETITGAEMLAIIQGRDPALAEVSLPGDIEPPAKSIRMSNQPVTPPSDSPADPDAPDHVSWDN